MSGSEYRPSREDGLPARVSGSWAQEKLAYLAKYMSIFNVGMKNRWPHRLYLDLLAGPGRCVESGSTVEFDGSPLLAVNCQEPFTRVILVESDPELAGALSTRVGTGATVVRGDSNEPAVIDQLREPFSRDTLGLAFVDNLGLDVTLETLRRLTDGLRLDLFITFQLSDLKRNLGSAVAGVDAKRWTAFFGNGWREVAIGATSRNLAPAEAVDDLLLFYGDQLGTLGYSHIAHSQRIMKNSTNVGLYRVLLAGKHEKAAEFFDKISKIDPHGQRALW